MGSHVDAVVRWFGVGKSAPARFPRAPHEAPHVHARLPAGGEILLVTGASGAGKSTLLRDLVCEAQERGKHVVDMARVRVARDRAVVDALGLELEDSLGLLSSVGLAEANTYVQPAGTLSEGQAWRLRLAIALSRTRRKDALLVADEFAAVLDRVTAMAVAHSLRRVSRRPDYARVGFVVATSHSDLSRALAPDRVIHCDFGKNRIIESSEH